MKEKKKNYKTHLPVVIIADLIQDGEGFNSFCSNSRLITAAFLATNGQE